MAIHTAPDLAESRQIDSASLALTASLAAAAAEQLLNDPASKLDPILSNALGYMAETVESLVQLLESDAGRALLSRGERQSDPIVPFQLVAALAVQDSDEFETEEEYGQSLRDLREDLRRLGTSPDEESARRVEFWMERLSNSADDAAHEVFEESAASLLYA